MIFTPIAGGIGDLLTYYLEGELGYFESLVRSGRRTKVVVWSDSDQARSVFEHNPWITEIDVRPFRPVAGLTDGFRGYAQQTTPGDRLISEDDPAMKWRRPDFFLHPDEYPLMSELLAAEPYVAVHPFAGQPERSLAKTGLARVIVETAAKHGRVVVLGGNSVRGATNIFEGYDIPHPNVISLVNRGSVRLHALAASRARKFIGAMSCYNCVAQTFGVPALVYASVRNRRDMAVGGSVFAKMRANGTPVHYLDDAASFKADIVREFVR